MRFFSLFLFRVADEVSRSAFTFTGLDFQKFTHLLCKSSNSQQSCKFPDKSLQIVISAESISVLVFNGLLQLYRPCTLTFVINQIAIFEHYDKYLNISLKLNSKYSEFFLLIVQNSYFMAYLARFLLLCLHHPETKIKRGK